MRLSGRVREEEELTVDRAQQLSNRIDRSVFAQVSWHRLQLRGPSAVHRMVCRRPIVICLFSCAARRWPT